MGLISETLVPAIKLRCEMFDEASPACPDPPNTSTFDPCPSCASFNRKTRLHGKSCLHYQSLGKDVVWLFPKASCAWSTAVRVSLSLEAELQLIREHG